MSRLSLKQVPMRRAVIHTAMLTKMRLPISLQMIIQATITVTAIRTDAYAHRTASA